MLIKNRLSWDFRVDTSEKEDPALLLSPACRLYHLGKLAEQKDHCFVFY